MEDDLISKNKKSIIFLCSNEVLNKLNEDFNITINEPNVKTAINRQKDENYVSPRSFSKPTLPKGFLSKWYFFRRIHHTIQLQKLLLHTFADFEEIENYLWDINHQYDFADLKIIGYSHEDRPIYVLEIDHHTVS